MNANNYELNAAEKATAGYGCLIITLPPGKIDIYRSMRNKNFLKYVPGINSGIFMTVFGIVVTVVVKRTYSGGLVIKWIIAGILFGIFAHFFLHTRQ
jgi:hypothetical protein